MSDSLSVNAFAAHAFPQCVSPLGRRRPVRSSFLRGGAVVPLCGASGLQTAFDARDMVTGSFHRALKSALPKVFLGNLLAQVLVGEGAEFL